MASEPAAAIRSSRWLGDLMPTYLARYQAGAYEQVWAELGALGGAVRQEPVLSDALAVARATMDRAGENIKRLVASLQELGYRFDYPDEIITPPHAGLLDPVEWLDHHGGPLPLSLRAWYEVVGGVDLMGRHPDWDARAADPMVVFSVELAAQEFQDWRQWRDEEGMVAGLFAITVAPDRLQKAGGEGNRPYQIQLPAAGADAPLVAEGQAMTFVDYVRGCFRWGGFPGLAGVADPPRAQLAYLTRNLLPL
jgi:hypothetical protein